MNYGKETWDKNILKSGELIEDSVSEKISATAAVGDVMLPPYCIPMRVARVRKFKINVTSHLKIIILIIKDIQISKCDIIFENGRFWAFEGVGVPIFSHPYRGILSHFFR